MKVLITGASGFIGSEVLLQLLAKGCAPGDLYLLGRSRPNASSLLGLRLARAGLDAEKILAALQVVETSFEDEVSFANALAALGAVRPEEKWRVVHLAAVISTAHAPQLRSLSEADQKKVQLRVNLGVTADLLAWSASFADRFVYASSVVAFGGLPSAEVRSEKDFPHFPEACRSIGYFASKRAAHEYILENARVPALLYCPAIVHGAFENFKSSRGHLKLLREGRLRVAPPGGGSFVGLDRVAEAISSGLLESPPVATRTQLLVDENLSYAEYFRRYVALYRQQRGQTGEGAKIWKVPVAPVDAVLSLLKAWPWDSKLRAQALESLGQSRYFLYFKSEVPAPSSRGLDAALMEHFNTLS